MSTQKNNNANNADQNKQQQANQKNQKSQNEAMPTVAGGHSSKNPSQSSNKAASKK